MAKYKKKPVIIEAFRLGVDFPPNWFWNQVENNIIDLIHNGDKCSVDIKVKIKTLEGIMTGDKGDYIIQGIKGECYPCKPDIFEEIYEKVIE